MKSIIPPLFLVFLIAGCQAHKKTPASALNSVVFTEYGSAAYSSQSNSDYLKFSKDVGFNTASILFTCHVKDIPSAKIDCISNNSPKLKRVTSLISQAKSQGMKISLRLYIDVLSGDWRALWNPKDKALAFAEIRKTLVRFAKISQKHEVDLFVIGAELEKLTRPEYTQNWVKIIQDVRSHYKGKLTYGANGNYSSYKVPEHRWIGFWDQLDAIGIDYYTPLKQTLNVTKQNFSDHHCQNVAKLQKLYKGKNLFINEVGFPAAKNGHTKPYEWVWPKKTKNDFKSQAQNISAFFDCLKGRSLLGVSIWRYMPKERLSYPNGYILDDSKTMKALHQALQGP